MRKLNSYEESYWANPIKEIDPKLRPFLSDTNWPDDPRNKYWESVKGIMIHFYCKKRHGGAVDLNKLKIYLANPQKYMIIWGEVGIGKSWFIRYELIAGEHSMDNSNTPYHAGIIDMLNGVDPEYAVYKQLKPLLEKYFERFYGGTKKAIEDYIKFDYSALMVKSEKDLTQAELTNAQLILKKWLELRSKPSSRATKEYVHKLLDALQFIDKNELLILAIDNIDKTNDEEQERLVKLSVKLLRHPKIRLIIPLRKSSRLFGDRFSVLKEFSYDEMELHPVDLREMLKIRFSASKERKSLRGDPQIKDPLRKNEIYTFPKLYTMLFGQDENSISESGDLLLTISAQNARESLSLTEKLIYSDQLKGFHNIHDPEFAVAALMLSDTSQPEVTPSCLLNLFNNEEPSKYGNVLIRYRILEYFWEAKKTTTSDVRFQNYFQRLGYDLGQIKKVLELFLMTQIIKSDDGLSLDAIRCFTLNEIGALQITKSGNELRSIIERIWYWVSVKKDVYFPERIIFQNDENGYDYITHTDFIDWLKEAQTTEKQRIAAYERIKGRFRNDWTLSCPAKIASKALKGEKENTNSSEPI